MPRLSGGAADSFDAIVVGAGAAGGWAAKELCEAGLRVLLVDAGPEIDVRRAFPVPARPPRLLTSRLRALADHQRVQLRCAAFNARTRAFFVDDRQNPYTTPPDAPFNWFRGRQVGGRLHLWARLIPRVSDLELGAAAVDGQGADWPLRYDDLSLYYDRVEEFLGAHGEADGLAAVPDGRYRGAVELTRPERSFRDDVERKYPDRHVISARMAAPCPARIAPTLAAAQRTGRLALGANMVVREVLVDARSGRASGVVALDRRARTLTRPRANLVVLCASTIETLRIMLNSRCDRHPRGLGNSSGRLGSAVMDSVLTAIGGRHRAPAERAAPPDPYDLGRLTGFQIPRFMNLGRQDAAFLRGYGIQGGICRDTPSWYLLAQGEMLPRPENGVTLNSRVTDAWGVPAAHIACRPGQNELAMAADQLRTLHELAAAAGLQASDPPSGRRLDALALALWRRRLQSRSRAFVPGSAVHEVGGAAMGRDSASSVLDQFNRCWDADNVLVTDGASFPSGFWQNATLTIMALTVRACEHIAGEYAAGRV